MSSTPLEPLLAYHGRSMRRLAGEIVGDTHFAEDMVQDAYLRGRGRPGAVSAAWWRSVVRNLGRSHRLSSGARRRRERLVARSERLPSTVDELERAEVVRHIAQAVHALPEPYRAVILMRFWDGLPPREIARRRDVPLATVKSQLQRGLQQLRQQLSDSSRALNRGLAALALPLPRAGLLLSTLLMQVNLKLVGVSLVLATAGIWYVALRGPESSGAGVGPTSDRSDIVVPTELGADESSGSASDREALLASVNLDRRRVELQTSANALGSDRVRLRGRVLDDSRNAVVGAALLLTSTEMFPPLAFATVERGTFDVPDVLPGEYTLSVRADGCVPWSCLLTLPRGHVEPLRDLILARGRPFGGLVVDESNQPVPDAQVFLVQRPEAMGAVGLELLATAGNDGTFEIRGLPARALSLGVIAADFVPELVRVSASGVAGDESVTVKLTRGWTATARIDGGDRARGELRLRALPATGAELANDEFEWTVHTQSRWPVEGADPVRLGGLAADVRYYLQLEELTSAGDWRSGGEVVAVSADSSEVRILYRPVASVMLTARDARDGRSVEDFHVLVHENGDHWRTAQPTSTGSDLPAGSVALEFEPGEPIVLRVHAKGYAVATLDPFTHESGDRRVLPVVELQPARGLHVQVRDAHTSQPVSGASVRILEDPTLDPPVWSLISTTDDEGRAQVTVGSNPAATVHVEREGYCPRTLVAPAASEELVVDLGPAATAIVQVVDENGVPVEGIAISCQASGAEGEPPRTKTSDLEGRVVFNELGAGKHAFAAVDTFLLGQRIMMGGSIATVTISNVKAPGEPVTAELEFGRSHSIEIIVPARVSLAGLVLEGGVPQIGVALHLLDRHVELNDVLSLLDLGEPHMFTDAAGEFRFPSVASGDATLFVTHPERRFPFAVDLQLQNDEESARVNLPFTSIRGVVRDVAGQPLAGASVSVGIHALDGSRISGPGCLTVDAAGVFSFHQGETRTQVFETDTNGRYEVSNAPPGYSLELTASAAFAATRVETVRLVDGDEQELDFTLEPAGELVLDLVRADGSHPINQFVRLMWAGTGSRAGREKFSSAESTVHVGGLSPGDWTVEVSDLMGESEPTVQRVTIRASEATRTTATIGD